MVECSLSNYSETVLETVLNTVIAATMIRTHQKELMGRNVIKNDKRVRIAQNLTNVLYGC